MVITIDGQGVMSGTIPGAPLLPGSVQLQFVVEQLSNVPSRSRLEESWTTYESTRKVARQVSDDTAGGWRGVVGAIDYQIGDLTILALGQYSDPEYTIRCVRKSGYIYKLSSTYTSKTQTFNGDTITTIARWFEIGSSQTVGTAQFQAKPFSRPLAHGPIIPTIIASE